jgi:cobalamin biosynthesis protein CobT
MLRHDAEVYRFHVGFPEYVFLTCRKLRAFAKRAKVSKWRDVCRTLISLLDSYSSAAKRGRERLGKAPMLITEFEALRGAAEPVAAARLGKLLAGRAFAPAGDVTVSLAPKAKAGSVSVSGLGAMKAQVPSAEDNEEDEDEDDEEDEEDEDDEDEDQEDEDEDEDQEDEDDDDDGEDRVEEIGRDFLGDSDED